MSNRLTFGELFRVSEFLRSNEERWKREQPSFKGLSRIILAELGVLVNSERVKEICLAAGVKWEKPTDPRRASRKDAGVTARVAKLEADLCSLRASFELLCRALGEPNPEVLGRGSGPTAD